MFPLLFLARDPLNHPEIKFILSYHHFTETPEDLEAFTRDAEDTGIFL